MKRDSRTRPRDVKNAAMQERMPASLQESTTLPSALSAARKQEFRLSRRTTDLYTAANATQLRDSNPTL